MTRSLGMEKRVPEAMGEELQQNLTKLLWPIKQST